MNSSKSRAWLTGIAMLAVFISLPATAVMAAELSDIEITDAIENEMRFDPSVPLYAMDVSTVDGIVTLTGRVNDVISKERAARIARAVKGVRSVVNRVDVEPWIKRTDAEIQNDITTALTMDPATESYEVGVEVSNGSVVLTGNVDSWDERDLASKVAKSVGGVRALDNQINVDYEKDRSDYEIRTEIEKVLEWDVLVDDGLIDVDVQDGKVTLSGTVGSAAERFRARTSAWVAGVRDVDVAALEVSGWARDEELRQHKYVVRPDSEVTTAVEEALARDPRVASFDVNVATENGVVTLRGIVHNVSARRAAEQDARNTVSVAMVENRLRVRPITMVRDEELEASVVAALARDATVESYELDVDVTNGKVFLDGEVDSYFEKFHADDVAARVEGVVSVRNNIDVDYDDPIAAYDPYVDSFYYPYGFGWYDAYRWDTTLRSDADIKDDVEDELFWSPFVDADQVHVSVDDGVVTLTGTVDSWAERRAAIENAFEGGAIRVDNDLVVMRSASS